MTSRQYKGPVVCPARYPGCHGVGLIGGTSPGAPGLQVPGGLAVATVRADALVAPGLDDYGLHRRDFYHLAGAQQPNPGLRQVGTAVIAAGGAALDDDVQVSPLTAPALMAGLGPAFLLRPGLRTIRLRGLRGGVNEFEASLRGWMRRLISSSNDSCSSCSRLMRVMAATPAAMPTANVGFGYLKHIRHGKFRYSPLTLLWKAVYSTYTTSHNVSSYMPTTS